jgi:tRNA modification GTPase
MFAEKEDTIVAIATPPGMGGIGIIRVSGELALPIAQGLLHNDSSKLIPNRAIYANFLAQDGQVLDSGIVIFFKSPHSFTGEDVVEFHGHGGPIILHVLLNRISSLGARLAQPGEFSKRAFLNNKMDLVQAESIAALINAQTEQAAVAAVKTMQGEFSKRINIILEDLTTVRMNVEAIIDFPEDDIDQKSYAQFVRNIEDINNKIIDLLSTAKQGKLLNDGIRALILGKPNVGKSSLLNCLLGEDRVIVTDIPGTTRDIVSYKVNIDGLVIEFIDTAGMRNTDDLVEQIGIQKAVEEIKLADVIVLIKSAQDFLPVNINPDLLANKKIILLMNKIDLLQRDPKVICKDNMVVVLISTLYNQGLELFKQTLKRNVEFTTGASTFIAQERHVAALHQVYHHMILSRKILMHDLKSLDVFAEELRLAQEELSQITGAFSNEDLLNKIFAAFCIGK